MMNLHNFFAPSHANPPSDTDSANAEDVKTPLDPSVEMISKMFPSMTMTSGLNMESPSDIPPYAGNVEAPEDDVTEKVKKKTTQNQRLKQDIQEKMQTIAQQTRQIDALSLELGKLKKQATEYAYHHADTEEKYLNYKKSDLHVMKQHYEASENYDDARKAEEELYNIHNLVNETKRKKDYLSQDIEKMNNLLSAAQQEVQTKNYNPQGYQFEDEDELKVQARQKFLERHEFLNPASNNPNYSPRLFQLANDLSQKLEDEYKINKRGQDVGSHQFYSDLSQALKQSLQQPQQNYNEPMQPSFYSSPSQNFSAPVGGNPRLRSNYNPPMSRTEQEMRERVLNAYGADKAAQYDEIFKNYKNNNMM